MVARALPPPYNTDPRAISQGRILDQSTITADHLTPPAALPPLSLPLPAPRKRTNSDDTDPESIILTPTEDLAGHSDARDLGTNVAIRADTPYPCRPDCLPALHDLLPGTPAKLAPNILQPHLPMTHQAKYHTEGDRDHPPKSSGSLIVQRILELTSTIDQVYTAYIRLDRRVQSPILILSLRDFRDRSKALKNASRAIGRNSSGQYTLEGELDGDERYVMEELERLEGDWWTSEVVANWFGPLPRQTQYRGRASGRGGGRTYLGNRKSQCRRGRGSAMANKDELGLMDRIERLDVGDVQELGEGIMSERAVDLRRLSSFVGLWDE